MPIPPPTIPTSTDDIDLGVGIILGKYAFPRGDKVPFGAPEGALMQITSEDMNLTYEMSSWAFSEPKYLSAASIIDELRDSNSKIVYIPGDITVTYPTVTTENSNIDGVTLGSVIKPMGTFELFQYTHDALNRKGIAEREGSGFKRNPIGQRWTSVFANIPGTLLATQKYSLIYEA